MTLSDVVTGGLLIGGIALLVLATLGVVVMRDAHDRLHYTGPAVFGAALVAIAVRVRYGWSIIGLKALAVVLVLLVTGPVLTHFTGRALRVRRFGTWRPRAGERIHEVEP